MQVNEQLLDDFLHGRNNIYHINNGRIFKGGPLYVALLLVLAGLYIAYYDINFVI